jgi:hypothetical protein
MHLLGDANQFAAIRKAAGIVCLQRLILC